MPSTDPQRKNASGEYARYVGLGFTFVFIIAVFTVGGYLLDRLLGTLPLFVLLGLFVGFVGALVYLFMTLSKLGDG
jgi:F0F1-type ATP synthase assembly protein I